MIKEELERRIVALEKKVEKLTASVVKDCRYCEGKGTIDYRSAWKRHIPSDDLGRCPVCKGKGWVRV